MEQAVREHESDRRLAALAASGDRGAQRRIAERLYERIRTTVWYLASTDRDFDDLVQEALLEVMRSLKTYQGRASLETWSERITVRAALRILKRRRKKEQLVRPGVEVPTVVPDNSEGEATAHELKFRLNHLLQQLSPKRRTVLVLKLIYRHTLKEIAELTGAPLNTVRDRLKVGKSKLLRLVQHDPVLRDWFGESGP